MGLNNAPLGHATAYLDQYAPDLLFPVSRAENRQTIGLLQGQVLPFQGVDCWNAYELSWLNAQGQPQVATSQFLFSADSSHIIESKSLKLYLNSLNNTPFKNSDALVETLGQDLSAQSGAPVTVLLHPGLDGPANMPAGQLPGLNLDTLNVKCDQYTVDPALLSIASAVEEKQIYHSHLLRSRCPVTGQPDWGSVLIEIDGPKLDEASLLRYIVSFRNHEDFHEHCVERIFMDLQTFTTPESLSVAAFYTRRGGLDINPIRSTQPIYMTQFNYRLWRQ